MKTSGWIKLVSTALFAFVLAGCEAERPEIDLEKLAAQPKSYVGSDQCKLCHLEHYDSWRTTLHSRTLQDVTKNRDALITEINPTLVRADLKDLGKDLRVPLDKVYIPNENDIRYTIGIQWKQQFLVEKNGALYIAPIQYNAWTNKWVNYHEDDWDKRPWIRKCGGCHATGVDLEKNTFSEPDIGCEACHGPGSQHVALPRKSVFDKRLTIINPSKFPTGIRTRSAVPATAAGNQPRRGASTGRRATGPAERWVPIIRLLPAQRETLNTSIQTSSLKGITSNTMTGRSPSMPRRVSHAPLATMSINWVCRLLSSRPKAPGLSSVSCAIN